MKKSSSQQGKIIYADVSLKGMTLEKATSFKEEATPTVESLLRRFKMHLPGGQEVSVSVVVDDLSYGEKAFLGARASPLSSAQYEIKIGAGLIAQLSVIARGIAADKTQLRGRTKSRLLTTEARGGGREKALGDFAFHFMLMFIVWHEVAHIVLGHIDWLKTSTGFGVIDEFSLEPLPDNEFTQRQALEADADRQAALWTAAYIDHAAEKNPYLRYTTKFDLFHDIGYIYGALFGLLDSRDPRNVTAEKRLHPKADVRLGVALAFVLEFLEKAYPESAARLHQQVITGGITAISKLLHTQKEAFNPLEILAFMTETGKRIESLGIRSFQHRVSFDDSGSFEVKS